MGNMFPVYGSLGYDTLATFPQMLPCVRLPMIVISCMLPLNSCILPLLILRGISLIAQEILSYGGAALVPVAKG